MNEKLQYATMLEIPINTCTIVRKPPKHTKKRGKKQRNPEEVKDQLVQMVNQQVENQTENKNQENVQTENTCQTTQVQTEQTTVQTENLATTQVQNEQAEYVKAITGETPPNTNGESGENAVVVTENTAIEGVVEQTENTQTTENKDQMQDITSSVKKGKIKGEKKPFKFGVISVQLSVIGVLLATIFLTNAFYAGSGLNAIVNNLFGNGNTAVDNRVYTEFSPVINCGGSSKYVFENGVFNFSGEGSVYSPCDGKVLEVSLQENGKYTIKVAHNSNFISVFSGLDYAYCSPNDSVFGNIPVGYISQGGAEMCFTDNMGEIISEYQVVDNAVIWVV